MKILKKSISSLNVPETDFGNITKSPQLGIFGFRAFLNLAMVMVESYRARFLRSAIVDIVIDTINQRTGGGTWTESVGRVGLARHGFFNLVLLSL